MSISGSRFVVALAALAWASARLPASAQGALESPWVEAYKSRARLLAGWAGERDKRQLYAVAHIVMPPGWKTYWKSPGESGIPPHFDWSQSVNLASAEVLYPAPSRIRDRGGDIVGYHDEVLFPVAIFAPQLAKPISLKLTLQYGICKDICVPAELSLALDVPPDSVGELPAKAQDALERVPRVGRELRESDPVLSKTSADLTGAKPHLTLEARFPGGADRADLFLDIADGSYLPLANKVRADGDSAIFEVDLSSDVDIAALKGKQVTATLVGAVGQSAATFRVE